MTECSLDVRSIGGRPSQRETRGNDMYKWLLDGDRATDFPMNKASLMPDDLQTVYERARARVGEEVWPRLSAHEQTNAVYRELRAWDKRLTERSDSGSSRPDEM